MDYTKEQLAEMMGEKQLLRPQAQKHPIIRLNGSKGVFMKLALGKDKTYEKPAEYGQMVEGVVIAVRMQLSEYTKDVRRQSNEYTSPKDTIRVWETIGGVRTQVAEGNQKDIREQYQGLRSRRQLYMVIGDDIVQLQVKGAGLTSLFEYFNELQQAGLHLFDVKTKVHAVQAENEGGISYYAAVFEQGASVSEEELKRIGPMLAHFHEQLKALADHYAASPADDVTVVADADATPDLASDLHDLPVIDLEDDIKPEDIPF